MFLNAPIAANMHLSCYVSCPCLSQISGRAITAAAARAGTLFRVCFPCGQPRYSLLHRTHSHPIPYADMSFEVNFSRSNHSDSCDSRLAGQGDRSVWHWRAALGGGQRHDPPHSVLHGRRARGRKVQVLCSAMECQSSLHSLSPPSSRFLVMCSKLSYNSDLPHHKPVIILVSGRSLFHQRLFDRSLRPHQCRGRSRFSAAKDFARGVS